MAERARRRSETFDAPRVGSYDRGRVPRDRRPVSRSEASESDIEVRPAVGADRPAVLALLADSLGWDRDEVFAAFFEWKHVQNPFGPSPAWVAVTGNRVVGFRTFLRWRFEHPDGRTRSAVRAVDTATAPDQQGRGIFRRLTMTAVDELRAEGVDFVFNTPNVQSRPGYLRMGWSTVGRMPLVARVAGISSLLRMRAVACARGTVAGRDHSRNRGRRAARRRARARPARQDRPGGRAAHREKPRVPPVAVRPARARLPGARDRRQPRGGPDGVPAPAPGKCSRGRRVGAARARGRPRREAATPPVGRARDRSRLRDQARPPAPPRRIFPASPPGPDSHLAPARRHLGARRSSATSTSHWATSSSCERDRSARASGHGSPPGRAAAPEVAGCGTRPADHRCRDRSRPAGRRAGRARGAGATRTSRTSRRVVAARGRGRRTARGHRTHENGVDRVGRRRRRTDHDARRRTRRRLRRLRRGGSRAAYAERPRRQPRPAPRAPSAATWCASCWRRAGRSRPAGSPGSPRWSTAGRSLPRPR